MDIDIYTECVQCFTYFIEYHMSYREISKEMLFKSHNTVKNRLEYLKHIDVELYDIYKSEVKKRKGGRRKA